MSDAPDDRTADAPPEGRRLTRAQQRAATRRALLDATVLCLIDDGYAGLTTRAVAERAGVSQSTVMHHFPSRETFLVETVTHLALRLADEALDRIDLSALTRPDRREAVLDQAWTQFTTPGALAAVKLWVVGWTEPEVARALRNLEQGLGGILMGTASAFFPELADDPRFPALIDTAVCLIQGLLVGLPISGMEATTARWEAMKPILLTAAADLLDGAGPAA